MMFANLTTGVLMWAVHFFSKAIPDAEYGTFVALVAMSMLVPTLPLQMVFAQQTAAALATGRHGELARMIRQAWLGLFLLWIVAALVVLGLQGLLVERWQLSNPAAIWITLLVWLCSLWLPMFWGLMQGKQDFLWMGWSMILGGVGRLGGVAVAVLVLGGYATGMISAAAVGFGMAVGLAIWMTRDLWTVKGHPFDRRRFLKQVLPLMLGFGACQFLFTADTLFVKAWFPEEQVSYYGAAGTLSRGVMWLVLPLAAVMFPKIVHSSIKAEKTDLMTLTLVGTAVLASGGAVGLWVVGPWVVPFVFKPSYVEVATALLPWYAGAMVPLSLANVLVNNLLARSQFGVVPWLVGLAAGYVAALNVFHGSLVAVLQTLAVFCTGLFLICVWFTRRHKAELAAAEAGVVAPGL